MTRIAPLRRRLAMYVAALGLTASAHAQQPPTYRAGWTADPITVDGRLDEFTWQAAPQVGKFHNIRGGEGSNTQASIAWDDRNLYFAFVCTDPEPWGTLFERDAFLWDQEVVEVFLDPDGDGKDYPELEISPHNVVVDLLIPAPGKVPADEAAKWDIEGLQTAVAKHAAGWTVEIAIPWNSLGASGAQGKPKIGDKWKVGLYRIERAGGPEANKLGAPLHPGVEYLAWAPTKKSFHEPERFGTVEFVLKP